MTRLLNESGQGYAIQSNTPTSTRHEPDTLTRIDTPKFDQLASGRLSLKRDHNNTLFVGPRPMKVNYVNELEQCTIENASEHELRA